MPTINIIDRASPQLNALAGRIQNPLPGLRIAGRAVCNLLKSHFQHKQDTEPNKMGAPRQNYWLGVKHAVNEPKDTGAHQVSVSISHPSFMQKVKGGQIVAKQAGALTIPMRVEAYGRRASVLENALGIKLFRVTREDNSFLAGKVSGAFRIFYLLKKSVNQKPDPSALPPDEDIKDTALKAFGDWVMASQQS